VSLYYSRLAHEISLFYLNLIKHLIKSCKKIAPSCGIFFKLKTEKTVFPEEIEQDGRNGTPVVDVSQYESIRRQSENQ
jgi:hypothetical protein